MKTCTRHVAIPALILILMTQALKANDDSSKWHYAAYRASSPIKVDGMLDEPAWKSVLPTPVFADIVSGAAPQYAAKAKIVWDDTCLYFAFEVEDPNIWARKIIRDDPMANQNPGCIVGYKADPKLAGGWTGYEENFVKVYIDPDGDGKHYIELHVSPLGKICDKWQVAPSRRSTRARLGMSEKHNFPHVDWNCPGLKVAVHSTGSINDPYDVDKGWTAEIAVPFKSIEEVAACRKSSRTFPPTVNEIWRIHLGRRFRANPKTAAVHYWTWPVIGALNCHEPDRWGYVTFRPEKPRRTFSHLPRATFEWKALWASASAGKTPEQIKEMVRHTSELGFNVIIYGGSAGNPAQRCWGTHEKRAFDPLKLVIAEAKKKGVKVYLWTINLRGLAPDQYYAANPNHLQKVRKWEDVAARMPRANPDRANVHGGARFLCPDHGLLDAEKAVLAEVFGNYDLDGIAFDYVGYRNYYACFCDHSNRKRREFAAAHPGLTERQILTQYSEECLIEYYRQAKEYLLSLKPDLKFTLHIYPDFDLNPDYGNRIPVTYCGLTAAWFYTPHWSYEKIESVCRHYKAIESAHGKDRRFVPLICIAGGQRLKTPDRLRTELRIAGACGARDLMMIYYKTLRDHPELFKVVREELRQAR